MFIEMNNRLVNITKFDILNIDENCVYLWRSDNKNKSEYFCEEYQTIDEALTRYEQIKEILHQNNLFIK